MGTRLFGDANGMMTLQEGKTHRIPRVSAGDKVSLRINSTDIAVDHSIIGKINRYCNPSTCRRRGAALKSSRFKLRGKKKKRKN